MHVEKGAGMDRFYIITNTSKDPGYVFSSRLISFLEINGKKCAQIRGDEDLAQMRRDLLAHDLNAKTDCLVVLGGDGSVLRAAHQVLGTGVPILGINLGSLGYLAEVERDNWQETVALLLEGSYSIEERMMLEGCMVERSGVTVEGSEVFFALNEAVIVRNSALRVLNFNVYVDGFLLNNFNADGIIISTPTGSTAYNLSAGGPLVESKAQLIVVTPICAHTMNTRSVVLSAEDHIVIEMVQTQRNEEMQAEAVFDGESGISLRSGDRIEIRRSPEVTNLVKLSRRSFLSTLHRKLSS